VGLIKEFGAYVDDCSGPAAVPEVNHSLEIQGVAVPDRCDGHGQIKLCLSEIRMNSLWPVVPVGPRPDQSKCSRLLTPNSHNAIY
jgi:hypothetical protein